MLQAILVGHNYDTIASFYDRMARLVFGHTLVDAQVYLLQAVPAGARVLIVGGGTGWVLEELTRIHASGLTITYVDASARMIAIAQKRNTGGNIVAFVAEPIQAMADAASYDVVLTSFFFDNFSNDTMRSIFGKLHGQLRPGGLWLYCDFQGKGNMAQRLLLRIMYVFFRVFCGVEAAALPDVVACYRYHGYMEVMRREWLGRFIAAVVYKRGDV